MLQGWSPALRHSRSQQMKWSVLGSLCRKGESSCKCWKGGSSGQLWVVHYY